ncbi:MAG: hypothetical protein GTO22_14240, partial [Gemmatimonadales bacterium]|nr:hypothetical protein [Gemmatimonadales bacterium]
SAGDHGYVDDVVVQGELIQYTLALSGVGSGSVRVDAISRSLPWSGIFAIWSSVSLEAVPDSGYEFTGWSGDLVSGDNPTTVTMDADRGITA